MQNILKHSIAKRTELVHVDTESTQHNLVERIL